jgi:3-oxoacyl-[acyl-carrier protein] reductase
MDLQLKDRTALVLGGSGGLSGAIAQALAAEGAGVALANGDFDAAERWVQTIREAGGKAVALHWELANLAVIDTQMAHVERELGVVDILVNITSGMSQKFVDRIPRPIPRSGRLS